MTSWNPRFGRANGFLVVDLESMETNYIDNGQTQVMSRGAGIQAAQLVAGTGVDCVLSGFVGPKRIPLLAEIPYERTAAEGCARGKVIPELCPGFRDIFVSMHAKIFALAAEFALREATHA